MLGLKLGQAAGTVRRVLCLGAHPDDLEIGCGGTAMQLVRTEPGIEWRWIVWSGTPERAAEARTAAGRILEGAAAALVTVEGFRDGYFPEQWGAIKGRFEALKAEWSPDLILTHHRADRHQDHRVIADLTWNTWRNNLILEYEIPKYEGDLHTPNLYVPLDREVAERKVAIVIDGFPSQRTRQWFDPEVLRGLLRVRGVECAARSGYAEGFHAPKVVLE